MELDVLASYSDPNKAVILEPTLPQVEAPSLFYDEVDAPKPVLNKVNISVKKKATYSLKVNDKVYGSTYKWTSSNTKVYKVNKSGKLTGVKKGKATITCKITIPNGEAYTNSCK